MKKIEFKVYDSASLPVAAAEFLNRNKFYVSKQKAVTVDELNQIQKQRGTVFSVLAFEQEKCIGMVAGYPVAGQKVALKHQIFMGSLIVDKRYMLIPSIIVNLFRISLDEIYRRGYREIRSETSATNRLACDMMRRHGFIMLDNKLDKYGYYELRNYLPAVYSFFGRENLSNANIHHDFYDYHFLPKVKRSNRYEVCEYFDTQTIKQTFNLSMDKITLYINVVSGAVTGFSFHHGIAVLQKNGHVEVLTQAEKTESVRFEFLGLVSDLTVHPNEVQVLQLPSDKRVAVKYNNRYFFIGVDTTVKCYELTMTTFYQNEKYIATFDGATGMLAFLGAKSKDEILRIPCAYYGDNYIEGALQSLPKNVEIFTNREEIRIVNTIKQSKLLTICKCSQDEIDLVFEFCGESKEQNYLYVQLWTKGNCHLHREKLDFADYPFWISDSSCIETSVDMLTQDNNFNISGDKMIMNLPSIMIVQDKTASTHVSIRFK